MNKIINNFKYLIFLSILLLTCFFLNQLAAFSKKVKLFKSYESKLINNSATLYETKCTFVAKEGSSKISSCSTNDPAFTDIIPNPVVYWYGTSTNEEPILLLNFRAGIPVKWLTENLVIDLDSIHLKLQIKQQYGYYYKILSIYGEPEFQIITYKPEKNINTRLEASYKGVKSGSIEYSSKKAMEYQVKNSIIAFYGVSSDTLTIMLKRGKKYPIPNCQIQVSMLVRAVKENPKDPRTAHDFYKISTSPYCDLGFNKSIVQVEKRPLFTKKLPFIAKIIVVPLVKLFFPKTYDVKVIKPGRGLFTTSRVIQGSHVYSGFCTQNDIIDFCNGTFRDDDVLYKEMELPYKIKENKGDKNPQCKFILKLKK